VLCNSHLCTGLIFAGYCLAVFRLYVTVIHFTCSRCCLYGCRIYRYPI